ncbi:putative phage tail protein [Cytobacillus kochii]|uniref:putative phage tail protein n=1 Tax=Cytobacillus kochii TaxID=859143 RepID=UPI00402AA28A
MMDNLRAQRMLSDVPDYYQGAPTFQEIQRVKAVEYDQIEEKTKDLQLQLNPATATWGLKYYEKELGIPTDENKPISDRRSNVISKRRGFGNFNARLIKTVAISYTNGEVEVSANLSNYEIEIRFVSNIGIPPNLEDFKTAIDNITHAHIGIVYRYRYLTINEVHAKTLNEVNNTQLSNFAPFLEKLS